MNEIGALGFGSVPTRRCTRRAWDLAASLKDDGGCGGAYPVPYAHLLADAVDRARPRKQVKVGGQFAEWSSGRRRAKRRHGTRPRG